eukprot:1157214-Pelagomonas_calceolata.AAC.3
MSIDNKQLTTTMTMSAAAAFCQQPLAGRVAGVLLHFVELLIGPKCGSIQVWTSNWKRREF